MCGIVGYLSHGRGPSSLDMRKTVADMTISLRHRGPDDGGIWLDTDAGIALGHRRLSIIELSAAGAQPMISGSERFVVVLNGEIYNFRVLRNELENAGHRFRGGSDTEVAAASFDEWGVIESLRRFRGMFALGIWDRQERTLYLARDRVGEKPLYYGRVNGDLVFASELKALRRIPGWQGEIDRSALALLLRYTYIPSPHCIYQGCHKVMPGTVHSFTTADSSDAGTVETYWSAEAVVSAGIESRTTSIAEDLETSLDDLLRLAVNDQMVADVPIGAFLSGGIDSSVITAIMQQLSPRPVQTFSIGFDNEEYNEARFAAQVAAHLGTEHTELYVTSNQARDVIPLLPVLYDEPFSDSSQIPTYLIAHLARQSVTVALTGDGGDELFGGYNRYQFGSNLWRQISRFPIALRSVAGRIIRSVSTTRWNRLMRAASPFLPIQSRHRQFGQKLHKLTDVWESQLPDALYLHLISLFQDPSSVVIGGREPEPLGHLAETLSHMSDFTDRMMFVDLVTYLPDDILVKVDRASMGVGLETRVPFLDPRIVEFGWALPRHHKIHAGIGKRLLRQVLGRYVPRPLFERPKMGFGVPIEHWLRGALRDWGEDLLDEARLRDEGYFDVKTVRNLWNAHVRGEAAEHYRLWPLLMFQAWNEHSN